MEMCNEELAREQLHTICHKNHSIPNAEIVMKKDAIRELDSVIRFFFIVCRRTKKNRHQATHKGIIWIYRGWQERSSFIYGNNLELTESAIFKANKLKCDCLSHCVYLYELF